MRSSRPGRSEPCSGCPPASTARCRRRSKRVRRHKRTARTAWESHNPWLITKMYTTVTANFFPRLVKLNGNGRQTHTYCYLIGARGRPMSARARACMGFPRGFPHGRPIKGQVGNCDSTVYISEKVDNEPQKEATASPLTCIDCCQLLYSLVRLWGS